MGCLRLLQTIPSEWNKVEYHCQVLRVELSHPPRDGLKMSLKDMVLASLSPNTCRHRYQETYKIPQDANVKTHLTMTFEHFRFFSGERGKQNSIYLERSNFSPLQRPR